ncbi:MAG: hypothetical protein J0L70_18170 [Leptolyngbya sp. UWPOB_LEPTO1]|uniref:hypothetical protein n=1 Tax=Leptolyngbya sp. UWPOB_LEPTO1 TaxID=2815653 RepID=UPI001AD5E135|nr:hypothetical protein [Leptolyngbya sp. UWPOB_LEPTO1]MBN8562461.1 hypothetical protein [Leptolyngbya sp. UWPOB_LEPTO1]
MSDRVCVPSGRTGTIVEQSANCPIVLIEFDDSAKFWMPMRIVKPAPETKRKGKRERS